MNVVVSLIVLLRGFPCFHDFLPAGASHPYVPIECFFTLVQLQSGHTFIHCTSLNHYLAVLH